MNDGLPHQMPPRPGPPTPPTRLHPTTRVPRVFSLPGTIVYAGCSLTALIFMIGTGFGLQTPWFVILPCLLYVFISSGIIAYGRIESNRDSKVYLRSLQRVSEANKRMRKMN